VASRAPWEVLPDDGLPQYDEAQPVDSRHAARMVEQADGAQRGGRA
jgi:hypothetical protein